MKSVSCAGLSMATSSVKASSIKHQSFFVLSFLHLVNQCCEFVDSQYPGWRNLQWDGSKCLSYCFPPYYSEIRTFLGPTDTKASGYYQLPQEKIGDDAEEALWRCLTTTFDRSPSPPIVILQPMFKHFGNDHLFRRDQLKRILNSANAKIDGEVTDTLIFDTNRVILIEVKSISHPLQDHAAADLSKGINQLDRAVVFLQQVKSELVKNKAIACDGMIDIVRVIALPLMISTYAKDLPSDGRQDVTFLYQDDIKDSGAFNRWFNKLPRSESSVTQSHEAWQILAAVTTATRCVIKRCGKSLQIRPSTGYRHKLHEIVHTQGALEKAFQSVTDVTKKGRESEVQSNEVTVKKLDLEGHSRQVESAQVHKSSFVFLNSEQLSCWEGCKRQFLCGCYGSGKTLLLQHMTLACSRRMLTVCLFDSCHTKRLYGRFFRSCVPTVSVYTLCDAALADGNWAQGGCVLISLDEDEENQGKTVTNLRTLLSRVTTFSLFGDELSTGRIAAKNFFEVAVETGKLDYFWVAGRLSNTADMVETRLAKDQGKRQDAAMNPSELRQTFEGAVESLRTTTGLFIKLTMFRTHMRSTTDIFNHLSSNGLLPQGSYCVGHRISGDDVQISPYEIDICTEFIAEVANVVAKSVHETMRKWCFVDDTACPNQLAVILHWVGDEMGKVAKELKSLIAADSRLFPHVVMAENLNGSGEDKAIVVLCNSADPQRICNAVRGRTN